MKKLIFTVLTLASVTGMVTGQQPSYDAPAEKIHEGRSVCVWQSETHDFGVIGQGKPVSYTYEFTNTGDAPLVISSVQPGCGCTTQSYTKEPVAPGKKGSVTLTYNAAALGRFSKSATVNTNGQTFVLSFNGEVK